MRLLVCGPRDWTNDGAVFRALDRVINRSPDIELVVISGCAPGVDSTAIKWGESVMAKVEKYPAEWSLHGRLAGPIRNRRMLDVGKPDKVIAFQYTDRLLTPGTRNMVDQAEAAGVPVEIYRG